MNETNNPWTVLAEKAVYDNKWISVTEFDVLNPSGGKGIYGKVHFKNTAIGILPLDEYLNTWLVGQFRFTIDHYTWEIPEGGGAVGETILDAAKRELLEETGLLADKWTKLLDFHLSNSVSDEYGQVFLAAKLQQFAPEPEETEQLQIRKLPFEEAYQMVERGVITDSLSVAAIQKVKLMQLDGRLVEWLNG